MALGLLYTCRCGQRFKAYVPKGRLFRDLTGQNVDWGSVDERDEQRGDIREVERLAAMTDSRFVDLRANEQTTCCNCNLEIDLLHHFRTVITGTTTSI